MRFAIAIVAILVIPVLAHAATLNVPGQYPTIQNAIDAASSGDTVLVAPGTYVENLGFKGKAITVKSNRGASVTTINGKGWQSVSFNKGEGNESVLDGFTLTSGSGSFQGGGIYCSGASPTITNNIISDSTSSAGGGIYCEYSPNPLITNNIISGNTSNWDGGGIYSKKSSPTFTNNTVYGNKAGGGFGGGIYCDYSSSMTVANTILWNNTAKYSGSEIYVGNYSYPSTLSISYSDVKGGKSSVYNSYSTLNWGPGMIDAYPIFVDPAIGDFHITFNSPCKDAGDDGAVASSVDFEGDPRIAYGTGDMGADEFYPHLYWTGYACPNGSVALKFIGIPGTNPVQLWLGSGVMDPALPTKYGDWYLKYPLLAQLGLGSIPAPDGLLVFPFTFPPDTPVPLSLPFQAGIGVQLTNLSVMNVEY